MLREGKGWWWGWWGAGSDAKRGLRSALSERDVFSGGAACRIVALNHVEYPSELAKAAEITLLTPPVCVCVRVQTCFNVCACVCVCRPGGRGRRTASVCARCHRPEVKRNVRHPSLQQTTKNQQHLEAPPTRFPSVHTPGHQVAAAPAQDHTLLFVKSKPKRM